MLTGDAKTSIVLSRTLLTEGNIYTRKTIYRYALTELMFKSIDTYLVCLYMRNHASTGRCYLLDEAI